MEALYEKKRSYTVHGYINLGNPLRDKPMRKMSVDDLKLFQDMMFIRKEYNLIAFETITLVRIMNKIGDRQLYPIIMNLNRVCNSAIKQRDLCYAVSETFIRVEPMSYEIGYINRMMKQMRDRISFVRSFIIPENIVLTPVQDYLEAVGGKNFEDEIVCYFGNRHAVFEAMTDNAQLEEYILHIYETAESAGKKDAYRERLEKYFRQDELARETRKQEKLEEQQRKDRSIADAGIYEYRKLFSKAVRTMESCEKIGLSKKTLEKMIDKHSRNMFVVVRCKAFQNRSFFRYLKQDGDWGVTLASAKVFRSEKEANEKVIQLTDQHPECVYDTISPKWA